MERGYPKEAIEMMREGLCWQARKERMAEEELRKMCETYIAYAFSNPTPEVRERLATCPRAGELPTPEEFLLWFLPQIIADWEE